MQKDTFSSIDRVMRRGVELPEQVRVLLEVPDRLEHAVTTLILGEGLGTFHGALRRMARGEPAGGGVKIDDFRPFIEAFYDDADFLSLVIDVSETCIDPTPLQELKREVLDLEDLLPGSGKSTPAPEELDRRATSLLTTVQRASDMLSRFQRVLAFRRGDSEPIPPIPPNWPCYERDRWIVEKVRELRTNKEIMQLLKIEHPEWDQVDTSQAISNAKRRYIERVGRK